MVGEHTGVSCVDAFGLVNASQRRGHTYGPIQVSKGRVELVVMRQLPGVAGRQWGERKLAPTVALFSEYAPHLTKHSGGCVPNKLRAATG